MGQLAEHINELVEQANGGRREDVQALLDWVRLTLPPLERSVRAMDRIMSSANDMMQAAEKSGYDALAIDNAYRAHERQMGKVYADFAEAKQRVEKLAKDLDLPFVKAKSKGQKSAPKNLSGMTPDQLTKDAQRLAKGLVPVVQRAANEGAFVLKELRKIGSRKNPRADTLRNEVAAIVPDFIDYRDATGMIFGMIGGLVKRLNMRADVEGGAHIIRQKKPRSMAASTEPPKDIPSLIEHAKAREHARGMGFFESEADIEGQEQQEEEPMKYLFKVVPKDAPPIYAQTEDEAYRIAADYGAAPVVENASGKIDDPAVVEGISERLASTRLPWDGDADCKRR